MPERVALADPPTRRALGVYGAKALGAGAVAVGLAFVGALSLGDDGDARAGVPEFVPFVLIGPSLLLPGFAVVCLLRLSQMTWAAARHPWTRVGAQLDVVAVLGSNGQPVLSLTAGRARWRLTLAALTWRWRRFDRDELLVAARPGRGGLVATPDRRSLVWGGRSWGTALFLRGRRGRELGWPPSPGSDDGTPGERRRESSRHAGEPRGWWGWWRRNWHWVLLPVLVVLTQVLHAHGIYPSTSPNHRP